MLQVDETTNLANSGRPVFVGSEVVSVTFHTLIGGDNIGYIISSPIVELFLASVEKAKEVVHSTSLYNLWRIL